MRVIGLAVLLVSCQPNLAGPSPSPSVTATTRPTATALPSPGARASTPAATFAAASGGTCTSPTATPRQVLVRLFALSTSGDPKAASDCYAATYRRSSSFDQAMAMWVQDGPATNVVIRFLDTVRGCDRFHATAQMSATSFWMRGQGGGAQFFTVGPDLGGARIYETGTALVAPEYATTECGGSASAPVSRAVVVCGSLVRFASDGNTRLARLEIAGATTEYRLQVGYGTSTADPASGIPYPAQLTGREVPADSGSAQAINLVDYSLTRVSAC